MILYIHPTQWNSGRGGDAVCSLNRIGLCLTNLHELSAVHESCVMRSRNMMSYTHMCKAVPARTRRTTRWRHGGFGTGRGNPLTGEFAEASLAGPQLTRTAAEKEGALRPPRPSAGGCGQHLAEASRSREKGRAKERAPVASPVCFSALRGRIARNADD